MSKCLLEVWDADEGSVQYYLWFEFATKGEMRLTSQMGSTYHTVVPDQTRHMKLVLPPDATILESPRSTNPTADGIDQDQSVRLAEEGTMEPETPPEEVETEDTPNEEVAPEPKKVEPEVQHANVEVGAIEGGIEFPNI